MIAVKSNSSYIRACDNVWKNRLEKNAELSFNSSDLLLQEKNCVISVGTNVFDRDFVCDNRCFLQQLIIFQESLRLFALKHKTDSDLK